MASLSFPHWSLRFASSPSLSPLSLLFSLFLWNPTLFWCPSLLFLYLHLAASHLLQSIYATELFLLDLLCQVAVFVSVCVCLAQDDRAHCGIFTCLYHIRCSLPSPPPYTQALFFCSSSSYSTFMPFKN